MPTEDLSRLEVNFEDAVKPAGETAYYVRVTQVDGHQAWSSPIWVSRQRRSTSAIGRPAAIRVTI